VGSSFGTDVSEKSSASFFRVKDKVKGISIQVCKRSEGSKMLELPEFTQIRRMNVVSSALTTGRLFPAGDIPDK
jgi:hypothetical protein